MPVSLTFSTPESYFISIYTDYYDDTVGGIRTVESFPVWPICCYRSLSILAAVEMTLILSLSMCNNANVAEIWMETKPYLIFGDFTRMNRVWLRSE